MTFPMLVQPNWKQERRIFRNRIIQFSVFVVLQSAGIYTVPIWTFGVIVAYSLLSTGLNAWGISKTWHPLPSVNLVLDQLFTLFVLSVSGAGSGPFVFFIYLHVLTAIIFTGQRNIIIVFSVLQGTILTLATLLSQFTATPAPWQSLIYHAVGLFIINLFGIRPAEELHQEAQTDPLTGMLNRRSGFAKLESWLSSQIPFSLLVIDMKRFKSVNDTHGHTVGDEVLQAVAQRLRGSVRENDVVIRQGGDEFLIASSGLITPILERLGRALSEPIRTSVGLLDVTVDVGSAHYPEDGRDLEKLLAVADEKMYAEKQKVGSR
jgi:diguanylate cyclase (GGDEF)-like protein